MYDKQPDVGQSAALQKPLHKMLQRSTGVLEAWLEGVDTATRVEQQCKRNAAESINSIRRYCIKRQRKTEQEKETRETYGDAYLTPGEDGKCPAY